MAARRAPAMGFELPAVPAGDPGRAGPASGTASRPTIDQELVQDVQSLPPAAAEIPVAPESHPELEARRNVPAVPQPGEGRPQVLLLSLHAVEPGAVAAIAHVLPALADQRAVVDGMRPPHGLRLAAGLQHLAAERPARLQQPEPGLVGARAS